MLGASEPSGSPRFYPDDPLWTMPPPVPVKTPTRRKINELYDFVANSAAKQNPADPIRAQDVNSLGEVPDGLWYTNRHYRHPMSIEQLQIGPTHRDHEPVLPFRVVGAKTEGITPGFQIRDARNRHYFCKPDPVSNPEMATSADVIGSKFFYALGYNVPENYIAWFTRNELTIEPSTMITPKGGKQRRMVASDLEKVLDIMPRDRDGRYRVVASLEIEGKFIGPFRWTGTRTDDPNDIVLHEHRRELRGLYVFCAWLNHTDIKAGNTYDSVVDVNGVPAVRHHLIDFGSMLGSDSDMPKDARFGHEYMIEKDKEVLLKMFSLGLYSPDWERADYPHIPSVARFEAKTFDPDRWTPNYPNPAFLNRLPDDTFWAAKQVMAFNENEIRAMVQTAKYSNPAAVEYITRVLMERRDKIGRKFFAKVLPLDLFEVGDGQLKFVDLAARHGFAPRRDYRIEWFRFDNATGTKQPLPGAATFRVPDASGYLAARITSSEDTAKSVLVYLRGHDVVGIDRTW